MTSPSSNALWLFGLLCASLTAQAGPLNDTGITFGGNYPDGSNPDCSGVEISAQDCAHGRDALAAQGQLTKIGGGNAGFDFTKLDATGQPLPESATEWSCVRDNVTGLIWEVKQGLDSTTGNQGLHDGDDQFNWYNTDSSSNGGPEGYADDDGAICYGYQAGNPATYCNTQAFAARVNATGLCGYSDWRLPNVDELLSIVDNNRVNPSIDSAYFPRTASWFWFWSSSPFAYYSDSAWIVYFGYGNVYNYGKNSSLHVRLVRGGQ